MKIITAVPEKRHYRTLENVPITGLFQFRNDNAFYIKIFTFTEVNSISLTTGLSHKFYSERMALYYPDAVIHAGEPK